jgi:hypothetical protein
MPEDRYGYRVAFMEAFRNRGILPRDVRTISQETLAWDSPFKATPEWLCRVLDKIDIRWNRPLSRSAVYRLNESNCYEALKALKQEFHNNPFLYAQFGLQGGVPRYNDDGTENHPVNPGDTTFTVASVRPVRRVAADGSFQTDINIVIQQRQKLFQDPDATDGDWFWFRGGVTLVVDGREGYEAVRYAIVKNSTSAARQDRQRKFRAEGQGSTLAALYFGENQGEPFAMMHALGGK